MSDKQLSSERPLVCIQGLGFVGAAMATAVASARQPDGSRCFQVIGVDLPTEEGQRRVAAVARGEFPFASTDARLLQAIRSAHQQGNLTASTDPAVYERASVVVVDVHCDLEESAGKPRAALEGFRRAIAILGERVQPGTLIVVETTVPPGTCARVVAPLLEDCLKKRGLPPESVLLAHSYERVMPGKDYFDSIVNFWRVYAGHTDEAAAACEAFLIKVCNTREFPLTRLASTTASETAKVLENSYRAATIAFIEEWGRFAEAVGIDLFEVIDAVRMRPTHSNIRQPGFGVGGYCLTKDPLFAQIAARDHFQRPDLIFPFCTQAVAINRRMPLVSLEELEKSLGGSLQDRNILLMGVSYRQDVGDTRYSPSELFVQEARRRGAAVICHDPLVTEWPELGMPVLNEIPPLEELPRPPDAVVFAVPHEIYAGIDFACWLGKFRPVIFDANRVLTPAQRQSLRRLGVRSWSIGRGEAA